MSRWKLAYVGGFHKVVHRKPEEVNEVIKVTFKKLQRGVLSGDIEFLVYIMQMLGMSA